MIPDECLFTEVEQEVGAYRSGAWIRSVLAFIHVSVISLSQVKFCGDSHTTNLLRSDVYTSLHLYPRYRLVSAFPFLSLVINGYVLVLNLKIPFVASSYYFPGRCYDCEVLLEAVKLEYSFLLFDA